MTIGSGTGEDGRLKRPIEFLRRHPGVFVVVAVLGLIVLGVLNRTAGDDGDDGRDGGPVHQPPSRSAEDDDEVVASDDDGGAEDDAPRPDVPASSGATTTTVAPPDVARPRPPVDLEAPPDGSDPVEVARWWAAVYVSYVGAEPGEDLARRLQPLTTSRLRQDLASMPPGASYNEPIPIEGVTTSGPSGSGPGDTEGQQRLRVVVETPGALVIYNLVLEHSAAGWQVGEATRL